MEEMTLRLVDAIETTDGLIRARARVQSAKRHDGQPELTMLVTLNLPSGDEWDSGSPLPERIYDRVLAYLDIA